MSKEAMEQALRTRNHTVVSAGYVRAYPSLFSQTGYKSIYPADAPVRATREEALQDAKAYLESRDDNDAK